MHTPAFKRLRRNPGTPHACVSARSHVVTARKNDFVKRKNVADSESNARVGLHCLKIFGSKWLLRRTAKAFPQNMK